MKILGIAGTNGSGKDSVGKILADKHGYFFVSVTDILRDELHRRGLPTERENMRNLSAEWRRESGLGVLVDKAKDMLDRTGQSYAGLAMASLRNPGEVDRVHELGGEVIWVDADSHLRYERVAGRGRTDDKKTFEQFLAEEEAEMKHSGDAATLSMADVKAKADRTLVNNYETFEDFEKYIAEQLKDIL